MIPRNFDKTKSYQLSSFIFARNARRADRHTSNRLPDSLLQTNANWSALNSNRRHYWLRFLSNASRITFKFRSYVLFRNSFLVINYLRLSLSSNRKTWEANCPYLALYRSTNRYSKVNEKTGLRVASHELVPWAKMATVTTISPQNNTPVCVLKLIWTQTNVTFLIRTPGRATRNDQKVTACWGRPPIFSDPLRSYIFAKVVIRAGGTKKSGGQEILFETHLYRQSGSGMGRNPWKQKELAAP